MEKSTNYHLSIEFSKLRSLKRMKKNEQNTTDPATIEADRTVGTPDQVGTSGCTATPDWCTSASYSNTYPCFNNVCDICADSFHPISCSADYGSPYSSTIQLLEKSINNSETCTQGSCTVTFLTGASGEAKMTFQPQSSQLTTGIYDPLEQWQSSSLNVFSKKIAIYYRLQPGQTGENPPNGEWFLDQWTDGTDKDPPTSCICTAPKSPSFASTYELLPNSTVHQFFLKSDNALVSFYVTFDGTYVNVFTSNLTTLTAKFGQIINPTGSYGTTTTILTVNNLVKDSKAMFYFFRIDSDKVNNL